MNTPPLPRCPARMTSPAWGLSRGALRDGPDVPRLPLPALRHKRWIYAGAFARDLVVGAAVVDLGYAANAFAYVGALDGSPTRAWETVALPWQVAVDRRSARWRAGAQELSILLPEGGAAGHLRASLRAKGGPVDIDLALTAPFADAPVTCVAPARPNAVDRWNLTTKDNTLTATGFVQWGSERFEVRAPAIIDVTDAYPPRHTVWRWASFAGTDAEGRRVGLNLCELHNDSERARENLLWVDGAPYALGPVRFEFDASAPGSSRWTITGDGVELRFDPAGARFGHEDMVLIKSRFAQPYGRFSGTLRVGDVTSRIEGVAGVVEDHDALW